MKFFVFDALIIDRVFQPAVNYLSGSRSCFQIARFLCDGAMVLMVIQPILWCLAEGPRIFTLLMATGIVLLTVSYRMLLDLLEATNRPDRMNPARLVLLPVRAAGGLILPLTVILTGADYTDVGLLAFIAGDTLLVISAYVASCRLPWLKFLG